MRLLQILAISLFLMPSLRAAAAWTAEWTALLQRYATPSGVRYAAWHSSEADLAALRRVTDAIAANGPSESSRAAQLAYHLNAYNAWMLRIVLERYPMQSIEEIAPNLGVFTQDWVVVAGRKLSLNTLEKELIIRQFSEPRIHFAINCASRSCPPLLPEAFTPENLERLLDQGTRDFVTANPLGVSVTGPRSAAVSSLFDWYRADFEPAGGALAFINAHRAEPLPAATQLSFQTYDWALNSAD